MTTRARREHYRNAGYREVAPTEEELAEYRRLHGHTPSVYRVECVHDGARIWFSGIGRGSHERGRLHHDALQRERAATREENEDWVAVHEDWRPIDEEAHR